MKKHGLPEENSTVQPGNHIPHYVPPPGIKQGSHWWEVKAFNQLIDVSVLSHWHRRGRLCSLCTFNAPERAGSLGESWKNFCGQFITAATCAAAVLYHELSSLAKTTLGSNGIPDCYKSDLDRWCICVLTVKSDVGLTFCIYLEHFSFRRRKDFTEQDVTPIWLKSADHIILERIPVFKSHLYNIKWLDLFQLMYKLLMGSASKAPSTFIFINFVLYLVLMQIKKKYVNSISIVYTFLYMYYTVFRETRTNGKIQ